MSSTHDFTLTWLWRQAFAMPRADVTTTEQEFFRDRYLAMREKVGLLVSRIAVDVPGLTVHDLSHLDALWEMASLASEGRIAVNPAEAFVFGASVLLHDAAMSLAAFPNGLADIKQTITWRDTVASLLQDNAGTALSLDDPPNDIVRRAVPEVLRRLHAQKAAELAQQGWDTKDGDTIYLIEDEEVRSFYGQTIGQIAHSHWWPVTRIEQELRDDLGALSRRTTSLIDRVKLACLLRVADALHLDQRRAPRFLRTLVRPEGVSDRHWAFQGRIARPHVELEEIVFTVGAPFSLRDADAWWLAYDAISAVDRELRDVDLLMRSRRRGVLGTRGVKGAGTPESLAQTLRVAGWRPVDTRLRISDIPKIVETLGGAKLYGNDPTVALRELLQNSADAVQARRKFQGRAGTYGSIDVCLVQKDDGYWLSIEDNGIGMSEQVLTGPLIDFGNSFWRSPLAAEEFPGLVAAGMAAIGRYGIGFFSVFMLGSVVRVVSRRCDRGEEAGQVLEFRDGTASRPILYPSAQRQAPIDGGTRIEIRLKIEPLAAGGLLHATHYGSNGWTLNALVAAMAPNLDVAVRTNDDGVWRSAVVQDDWLALGDEALLMRLDPLTYTPREGKAAQRAPLMRTLTDAGGKVFGRAFIKPDSYFRRGGGWVTVGGLRAKRLANMQGVLIGEVLTVARDMAIPIVSDDVFAAWATEQAVIIGSTDMDEEQKANCGEVILECGGKIADLPIATWGGEWITTEEFRTRIASRDRVVVSFEGEFSYDEDLDGVHPREFKDGFTVAQDIVIVPKHNGAILTVGQQSWPRSITGRTKGQYSHLASHLRRILSEVWVDGIGGNGEDCEVGAVNGEPIRREVYVFRRGVPSVESPEYTDADELPF